MPVISSEFLQNGDRGHGARESVEYDVFLRPLGDLFADQSRGDMIIQQSPSRHTGGNRLHIELAGPLAGDDLSKQSAKIDVPKSSQPFKVLAHRRFAGMWQPIKRQNHILSIPRGAR